MSSVAILAGRSEERHAKLWRSPDGMLWPKRRHSLNQIDKAGMVLANPLSPLENVVPAIEVAQNWRAAHHYPLHVMRMNLRRRAFKIQKEAIVTSRLKRFPSMIGKLQRLSTELSQMQDIGGCRAVMPDLQKASALVGAFLLAPDNHFLKRDYNYIDKPKANGYRSHHLVYQFRGAESDEYDKCFIEIQIRTRRMHVWATAVESVDTFMDTDLKSGNGPPDWTRFFALCATAMALSEGTNPVPGTFESAEKMISEIRELEAQLKVRQNLKAHRTVISNALNDEESKTAESWLLHFQHDKNHVVGYSYKSGQSEQANRDYAILENELQGGDQAVLVSISSLASLAKSYPNFLLDTSSFHRFLDMLLK